MHECKNEERLIKLEISEAVMGTKLENLIKELDKLTSMLKSFILVMIPVILTSVAFLITYWVKK